MDAKYLRTLSDFIIILLAVGLEVWTQHLTPTRRGFYCDDESIRYSFNGETISGPLQRTLLFLTGLLLIIPTEYLLGKGDDSNRKIYLSGFMVDEWVNSAYRLAVDYTLSALFLLIFGNVMKAEVGSPRPSFIQYCKPNIDLANCTRYHNSYITDYECTNGENPDVRSSFPSGHALTSGYVTVFCVQYIQIKWRAQERSLIRSWKHILQALIATIFLWITLTRYAENMHHPIDLIVGYAFGAAIAHFTIIHICGLKTLPIQTDERLPLTTPSTSAQSRLQPKFLIKDGQETEYSSI